MRLTDISAQISFDRFDIDSRTIKIVDDYHRTLKARNARSTEMGLDLFGKNFWKISNRLDITLVKLAGFEK